VNIFYNYALAVGAFLICIFVGWYWKPAAAIGELRAEGADFPGLPFWGFLIRWFCPLVAAIILLSRLLGA
jgi:SNF family Na+-dependent transporter